MDPKSKPRSNPGPGGVLHPSTLDTQCALREAITGFVGEKCHSRASCYFYPTLLNPQCSVYITSLRGPRGFHSRIQSPHDGPCAKLGLPLCVRKDALKFLSIIVQIEGKTDARLRSFQSVDI